MFRPLREVQVPRYNSKRPQGYNKSDYKFTSYQLPADHQTKRKTKEAMKSSRQNLVQKIKLDKQNFHCKQYRNACEKNSERGFNLHQSGQSGSIYSGKISPQMSVAPFEESNSSLRSRLYPLSSRNSSELVQEVDPIIKFLLNYHNPSHNRSFSIPMMEKQQKSQNQLEKGGYYQANIKSHLLDQSQSRRLFESHEFLLSLRAKMIENLVMLFMRIQRSFNMYLQAPPQELSILANLVPIQVEKIHLVSSYLRRALGESKQGTK